MPVTETHQNPAGRPRTVVAVADPDQARRASEANASLLLLGSIFGVVVVTEALVALLSVFA